MLVLSAIATLGSEMVFGRNPGDLLLGIQVFEASGTYIPTAGARKATVICVGAGGGGGGVKFSVAGFEAGGGGGGGGAAAVYRYESVDTQTVTIGSGGTGGPGATNGAAGGTTSFGSLCIAVGGSGGLSTTVEKAAFGGAGGLATACTGDRVFYGEYGGLGIADIDAAGGCGGTSGLAYGGRQEPQQGSGDGVTGRPHGGGGSGASEESTTTQRDGGDGGDGLCVVWEFS